ncbi:MAG: hypothetical protein ACRD9S_05470 [Pyrinomonadaceae bacterium]
MHPTQSIVSELRSKLELSDLFIFLYLLVFIRQYMWLIHANRLAWAFTFALAAIVWAMHFRIKEAVAEKTPQVFWLIVALPLLFIFAMKFALPDTSFDVLNHRLIQSERGLRGPLFMPGDFFPTILPFNPASDMLTGISRHLLGYRLGTLINYLSLLSAGVVINKLLRPFIERARWRCLGVLLTLYTEHILFEINNYMVDLLTLPLLLEATRLALREDGDRKQLTRDLIYTALYLGACIAFKLTNVVAVVPIACLFAYRILRQYSWFDRGVLLRVVVALVLGVLPLAPHAIYIFRATGSPVFPLYNKVFGSPFWPQMNIAEGRFGPESLWQTFVWPVVMFFRPERIAELPVYSGRLTIGFIAAVICLLLPKIHRRIRLLAFALLSGSLLWSVSVGYIRYALYLELLSGILVVYLVAFTRGLTARVGRTPRMIALSLLSLMICILTAQFVATTRYAYNYEWSGRPAFFLEPGEHRKDARFVFRDRCLIDFLAEKDKALIAKVDVWIVSNIKMNGIQVLLRNDVPMISVNNLQYFDMPQSRERFAKALDEVRGRRMFSLSLIEDLNESQDFLKRRGLQPVQVTPLTVPFFSKHTFFYMSLIEVTSASKPPPPKRTSPEPVATESHSPLSDDAFKAIITMPAPLSRLHAGQKETIQVVVKNASDYLWSARGEASDKFFLRAGDIWLEANGKTLVNNLDGRSTVPHDLYPGEEATLPLQITAPAAPGDSVLEIDMVQEGVAWFKDKGSTPLRIKVTVE